MCGPFSPRVEAATAAAEADLIHALMALAVVTAPPAPGAQLIVSHDPWAVIRGKARIVYLGWVNASPEVAHAIGKRALDVATRVTRKAPEVKHMIRVLQDVATSAWPDPRFIDHRILLPRAAEFAVLASRAFDESVDKAQIKRELAEVNAHQLAKGGLEMTAKNYRLACIMALIHKHLNDLKRRKPILLPSESATIAQ